MELVIAALKSVAELGALDRAEDSYAIMDAKRGATLVTTCVRTSPRMAREPVRVVSPGSIPSCVCRLKAVHWPYIEEEANRWHHRLERGTGDLRSAPPQRSASSSTGPPVPPVPT